MKTKVRYSTYAKIITVILFLVPFVVCMLTIHEKPAFFSFLTLFVILLVLALLYGVAYIKVDDDYLTLGRLLTKKKIRIIDIESVERLQPTMGSIRICGSGGFMGYWGLFREGDIGRYYAFYGKASDCFLIRLKNGDKYVVGCESPARIIAHLQAKLHP